MRMKPLWKGIVLRLIGVFIFFEWFSGNFSLYIHERFLWLLILASFGLVYMGAVYHARWVKTDDRHQHQHGNFSWGGLCLVLIPIMLGLLAPRKPLGADAMRYRNIGVESMLSLKLPKTNTMLLRPVRQRNILDWLTAFLVEPELETHIGEKAVVSGFVYREDDFQEHIFLVSRFVITCCAADASPVGLYVYWPDEKTLVEDQWIEVAGHFELRKIQGKATPVLIAETVTLIDIPAQPYLYP